MDKKKIDKETAIKSILSDLKKGIDKPTILSNYVNKCQKSKRTVERWYDSALIDYQAFMSKALPIVEAKEIQAMAEVAASGILSKIERQKILSDIARGEIIIRKEVPTKFGIVEINDAPSHNDRKAAIAELNKMDGDYAPTKTEHSGEVVTTIISLGTGIKPDESNT